MRLSAFADVCLRTIMVLGAPSAGQLTSRQIAELINTPYNHVTKAVLELRTLGLIDVTRGRSGGASITAAGLNSSVGTLLRHLDWREDVVDCSPSTNAGACPLAAGCRLRQALRAAREAFYASLDELTVREVCTSPALQTLPFPSPRLPN
ncbi:nitric oxide-sensing transcriptional repressor NsrR [Glutamicibacter endophyticus]